MPRVSIAVPAYNCEKYIAQSLESLLGQTYGDFELVISDNASSDGTEEICRRYAALDRRVRYVRRTENIGGPGNFRFVWSLCSGDYHKWSTADDYWHKEFLAKSVAILDQNPDFVLCYPKTRLIDSDGKTISDYEDNLHLIDPSPRVRFRNLLELIGLCNAHLGLIRRSTLALTRLIAPHKFSDNDFLAELVLFGKFYLLPEVLFFRRFHPASSSWARSNDEHQRQYYDPGHQTSYDMHVWRKYWHLTTSVWRAPIPLPDKLGLTREVGRRARYDRGALGRELYARFPLSRLWK
jgi:glycosyltransferase involved in cell wall biosynthesis